MPFAPIVLLVAAHVGAQPQITVRKPVLLAAAFVRFRETDKAPSKRSVGVEVYPIATYDAGRWSEARASSGQPSPLQPGTRFEIYSGGAEVGWADVNRLETRPYLGSSVSVGLGGWSLPRRLYPYRLVRSTGKHFLAYGVYSWSEPGAHVSVQPFLALDRETLRRTRVGFLSSSADEARHILADWLEANHRDLIRDVSTGRIVLQSLQLVDLDDDRVSDVIASYDLPEDEEEWGRSLVLVGTIHAGRFRERYFELFDQEARPLDVLDVDSDGWQEVILTLRGEGALEFSVLQSGRGGRMRRVFTGGGFGPKRRS